MRSITEMLRDIQEDDDATEAPSTYTPPVRRLRDTGQDMTREGPIVPVEVTAEDIEREFPGAMAEQEAAAVTQSREDWLNAFIVAARPVFAARACAIPQPVRASVGFPSTGSRGKRIGECWSDLSSTDGHFEIFLHPTVAEASRVADILTHELCHAAVGLAVGHGKPFKQCAEALGLTGKMTATVAGPEWHKWADPILADLGPFPHGSLNGQTTHKKQSTRMIKCECDQCGFIFRASRTTLAGRILRCPDDECEGSVSVEG